MGRGNEGKHGRWVTTAIVLLLLAALIGAGWFWLCESKSHLARRITGFCWVAVENRTNQFVSEAHIHMVDTLGHPHISRFGPGSVLQPHEGRWVGGTKTSDLMFKEFTCKLGGTPQSYEGGASICPGEVLWIIITPEGIQEEIRQN